MLSILVLIFFIFSCSSFEVNELEKVRFLRKLPVCEDFWACCLIEKRYWTFPRIKQFCRCPAPNHELIECPCSWTTNKNEGIIVNNRAILRFCPPGKNTTILDECIYGEEGLKVLQRKRIKQAKTRDEKSSSNINTTIVTSCQCSEGYWEMLRDEGHNDNEIISIERRFQCKELKKFDTDDMCGVVRKDTWAAYYHGSCPKEHRCRQGDDHLKPINISELLYTGPGFEAHCIKDV